MITHDQLKKISLDTRPKGQIFVLNSIIKPDYHFPRKTNIIIENLERIPKSPVIFAMNHTDRYNYAPFMAKMYWLDLGYPFISPLVKGKYYEFAVLGKFFDWTNNIPLPSRGYLITKDFQAALKRKPRRDEYRLLRNLVDETITLDDVLRRGNADVTKLVSTPHGAFDPQATDYGRYIDAEFSSMMALVTGICLDALHHKNLSLIIFPEGTRSPRLLPGHTGVAQLALKTKVPVIPIGCNGSDKLYPSSVPFSSGGTVVYRVGEPLTLKGDLAPFAVEDDFTPFTREASALYEPQFRGVTDLVMARINNLLDPKYQAAFDTETETDTGRFV